MYPFNFIAIVAIVSLMVIASVDVLVIRKRELGHGKISFCIRIILFSKTCIL